MKRLLIIFITAALFLPSGCKKNEAEKTKEEGPIAKKYARYRVNVNKDKDLKDWLATLEKTEAVDLLAEEDYTTSKGKKFKLSKVKLADDSVGYVEARHLADGAVVFLEDTKALQRPTIGARVKGTIPRGKIGFIIGEKGNWKKIYIGKIGGTWITEQWVESGYSTDEQLIQEAKELNNTLEVLEEGPKDEGKFTKAMEKLKKISEGSSAISIIAQDEIKKYEEKESKKEEKPDEGETRGDLKPDEAKKETDPGQE